MPIRLDEHVVLFVVGGLQRELDFLRVLQFLGTVQADDLAERSGALDARFSARTAIGLPHLPAWQLDSQGW